MTEELVEAPEQSLDSIFSDDEAVEKMTAEPDESPKDVKAEEPEKDESPEKEAKVEDSPSESKQVEKSVPLAGLLDERDKRQAAERKAKELEEKLAGLTETEKRPSVFEDEDKAFSTLEKNLQSERLSDKFALSRDMMGMLKDDYEELEAEFLELAKEDDSLQTKLKAHANPARFAYETAQRHREFKEMENLDETKEKKFAEWREELKEELRKELSEETEKDEKKRKAATPSLASHRSVGGNDENIDPDLTVDDILEN